MVLRLKTRESRSLPGLPIRGQKPKARNQKHKNLFQCQSPSGFGLLASVDAGWSSPVARQAHNLKVRGSNPLPATTFSTRLVSLTTYLQRNEKSTTKADSLGSGHTGT